MSFSKNKGGGRPDQGIMASRRGINQSRIAGRSLIQGSGMSRVASGASRKSADMEVKRSLRVPVRLTDGLGNDYTPIPLLSDEKRMKDSDKETPTDHMSQGSFQQMGHTPGSSQQAGSPFGFTKSHMSTSYHSGESTAEISDEDTDVGNLLHATQYTQVKTKPEPEVVLTEQELDKMVKIVISESDTFWLLDMTPINLLTESDQGQTAVERNAKYKQLVESKAGNDRYVTKGMNTFDNPQIPKMIQTEKVVMKDEGFTSTTWEMYDTLQEVLEKERKEQEANEEKGAVPLDTLDMGKEEPVDEEGEPTEKPAVTPVSGQASPEGKGITQDTVVSTSESDIFGTKHADKSEELEVGTGMSKEDALLTSETMNHSLFIMERALNLNTYQEKLAMYRDLPTVEDILLQRDAASRAPRIAHPHLDLLWSYTSPLTKGRNVTQIAVNRQNPDILAISYGQYEFDHQRPGLVCCWSLKNVEHPERVYHLAAGVTAIDWSSNHPSLLAVGLYDGLIYVFDVRKGIKEAMIDTAGMPGRHLGPVRQLQWVNREGSRGELNAEVLVSISADGRVTQWSIRKGFESTDLMKLKRISTSVPGSTKQRKTDALISRYDCGTSIAFNRQDSNIYLAGTESGHIHKCSCSYNEQYLDSYFSHTGPVYTLQWSPFGQDIFISCAADWSIKLWQMDRPQPIINFQSAAKSVNSICWSPRSSVIFASVNEGAIEVWNLQLSTLDPVLVEKQVSENTVFTCVQFSQNSESLFVGDSKGNVGVYKLNCMPGAPRNQAETLDRVVQSCLANQLKGK